MRWKLDLARGKASWIWSARPGAQPSRPADRTRDPLGGADLRSYVDVECDHRPACSHARHAGRGIYPPRPLVGNQARFHPGDEGLEAAPARLADFNRWVEQGVLHPSSALFREGNVLLQEDPESGRRWPSVTNVGYRPTFGGTELSVETYLLRPLEGPDPERLDVSFWRRLREEKQFATPEELRAQILRDVGRAERFWRALGS